ncbi:MAG TPA: hypothetical protein PK639_00965 [Candidatus Woesebacteria bacterium]|nr:hypothetical protein [Candidatus Woesebacteria bacterium]
MTKNNSCCQCSSGSGFSAGLLLGLIVGAVVAIVIYKKNKGKIFTEVEKRIKDYFKTTTSEPKVVKPVVHKKPTTFLKAKK